jgi:glycosyltransferase involved in cell wall biosynthesis
VDHKIHLLQIIYSFDVEGTGGGIARFAIALSQALNRDMFDVAVCGLWNTGTAGEYQRIEHLNSQGIKAFTAADWDPAHPMRSLIDSYRSLARFIKQHPLDLIHSHSEFSDVVAMFLKVHPGASAIVRTLHNGYKLEWRKRPIRRFIFTNTLYPIFYRAEIGVAEHVVVNLDHRWLARTLHRKAFLLRNAIDFNRFHDVQHLVDKSLLGLGIPSQAYVIGTIGRLREEKGYFYLLEAVSRLVRQTDLPIFLIIIGTGDLADSLKAQSKALNIADRVIFTGPREDIEYLLSGIDLFVCSSLWEGFSTAILEAMAAGVQVLATDIPGNRELISPGVTGWIVTPGDPAALADTMKKIIKFSKEQSAPIIQAASNKAVEFTIDKVARQHEQHYQLWLKNKKG